jgi:hypothetical protein
LDAGATAARYHRGMDSSERSARVEHLFVVRVWYEAGAATAEAWRGSVEHTGSGARRYFADFASLTAFIAAEVRPAQASLAVDGKATP